MKLDIRKLRTRLDLGQSELGQLLGTHAVTVGRWERKETEPSPYQQALMAEFEKATAQKEIEDLKSMLFTAGVIAALVFLLNLAKK